MKTEKGLDKASEVILSGESAGGIGVWINYKWLRDALQQQDDQKAELRLVMAPLAGFYGFAHKYTGAVVAVMSCNQLKPIRTGQCRSRERRQPPASLLNQKVLWGESLVKLGGSVQDLHPLAISSIHHPGTSLPDITQFNLQGFWYLLMCCPLPGSLQNQS